MGAQLAIESVLNHWRATGISLNKGASTDQIEEVEKALGLKFPGALRLLYQHANGMPELGEDAQFFSLWPLERMLAESKGWGRPPNVLLFGDFLVASHAYGVSCEGPDVDAIYALDGRHFKKVANSLGAFFEAVVNNPDSVGMLGSSAV